MPGLYFKRSRQKEATNLGSPPGETVKTEAPCHSRYDTIKIPNCLMAVSAKPRPKLCSLSSTILTFIYECIILERNRKQYAINQYAMDK